LCEFRDFLPHFFRKFSLFMLFFLKFIIGAEPKTKLKLDVMKNSDSDRAFGSALMGLSLAASVINVLCDTPPLVVELFIKNVSKIITQIKKN